VESLERVAADVEGAAGLGERMEIGGIAFRIEIEGERGTARAFAAPARSGASPRRYVEVAVALR
jgi:hypothetical protein